MKKTMSAFVACAVLSSATLFTAMPAQAKSAEQHRKESMDRQAKQKQQATLNKIEKNTRKKK
jgi:hypothetical protein